MPRIQLNFPPTSSGAGASVAASTLAASTPAASTPAANGTAAAPTVELQYSLLERTQHWFDYYFRRDKAVADAAHRGSWCLGVADEVYFWDHFLSTKGHLWPDEYRARLDAALPLQDELVEVIHAQERATVRVLDVGAGPFTFVGRVSPQWTLEITATDPLADAYDQLLSAHGVTPPVRTINVAAEDVAKTFAANSFDLVTSRNALDHAIDPVGAIRQMVTVVKPGGYVYLSHHIDESRNNMGVGLHQWDFADEGGDFIIRSNGNRVNMSQILANVATVHDKVVEEVQWLYTTIHKHPR